MTTVNQFERAFRAWPVLTGLARRRERINYGGLAQKLQIHHRPVRFVLERIQQYCLDEKLFPLTILVENKKGFVGHGFTAWDVDDLDSGLEKVYSFDWSQIPNPFEFASAGATPEEIGAALAKRTTTSKEVYSIVRVRGMGQIIFREALLQVYSGRCAFSGYKAKSLLEAAHILPWSQCKAEDRFEPSNGILLSVLHHRLFDLGWVRIDESYHIQVNRELVEKESLSKEELALLAELNGKVMTLPSDNANWPSKQLIAARYKIEAE